MLLHSRFPKIQRTRATASKKVVTSETFWVLISSSVRDGKTLVGVALFPARTKNTDAPKSYTRPRVATLPGKQYDDSVL